MSVRALERRGLDRARLTAAALDFDEKIVAEKGNVARKDIERQVDFLLDTFDLMDEYDLSLEEQATELSNVEYTARHNDLIAVARTQLRATAVALSAANEAKWTNRRTRRLASCLKTWSDALSGDKAFFDHPMFHALADEAERAYREGDVDDGGFGE